VTEAAWDWLIETYPTTTLYWSFELTKKGFVPEQTRLESVIFSFPFADEKDLLLVSGLAEGAGATAHIQKSAV
jgi:hypothetical protein